MKSLTEIFCVSASAILLLGATPLLGQSKAPRQESISFVEGEQPLWTFSGAWGLDNQTFYMVDALKSTIYEYSLDGRRIAHHDGESLDVAGFRPTFIQRVISRTDPSKYEYVVDSGHDSFLWLSADGSEMPTGAKRLQVSDEIKLLKKVNEADFQLVSITTWTVYDGHILAFGDLLAPDGTYKAGYVSVPVSSPAEFSVIKEVDLHSPTVFRHYLGYSFSALLPPDRMELEKAEESGIQELNGAVIMLDDPLSLQVIRAGALDQKTAREPMTLPTGTQFQIEPPWEKIASVRDTPEKFAELAKSSTVVDLFADELFYYLLRREQNRWWLERIQRADLQPAGKLRIGTQADHLVLINNRDTVLLVEKQGVKGLGNQLVTGFVSVPYRKLFEQTEAR